MWISDDVLPIFRPFSTVFVRFFVDFLHSEVEFRMVLASIFSEFFVRSSHVSHTLPPSIKINVY